MRDWEDVKVKFDGNSTELIKLDYGLLVVSKPSLALLCQSARCVRTQLVRLTRVLQHTMPWPFLSVRPAVGTTVVHNRVCPAAMCQSSNICSHLIVWASTIQSKLQELVDLIKE